MIVKPLGVLLEAYSLKFCDIIVLSETWQIGNEQFNIDGYTMYYNYGDLNQNDGTIVFVKSTLNSLLSNIKLVYSGATLSKITLNINDITVGVACVYRPPSTNIMNFLRDIEVLYSENPSNQIEILIGDINIDLSAENNNEVNNYTSLLAHFGFVSAINSPTRVTSETSSILDHIFIKKNHGSNLEYSSFVLNSAITDHYPVMLNVSCPEGKQSQNIDDAKIKTYYKINYEVLGDLLEREDWMGVLESHDVEIASHRFYEIITKILQKAKFKNTFHFKEYKKLKPWITNGIINSIKTKDKLKKKLLLHHSEANKIKFREYRNKLNKIIQKQKFNYYKNEIETSKNNLKKIYNIISNATNNNITKNFSITEIMNNHKTFDNTKEMADFCNTFFGEVGCKMNKKIPDPTTAYRTDFTALSSMFLRPADTNEVIKQINSLKNDCAPGYDQITTKIVKCFYKNLVNPLVHIINLIFKTGIVPTNFKIAIITPIHKSGDKADIKNYRPISVINTFAKIFEKCLKDRLVNFFQQNNIISQNQYGFMNGLSTSDAICKLTCDITNNLDIGNKCIAVFLDLARAFDTVPHGSLLDVLESCGVRGGVLDVFASYLSGRSQMVKIGDIYSDPLTIRMGIPQGTVLGPILFNAYINSLTSMELHNGSVLSYADDTVVVFTGPSWLTVRDTSVEGMGRIKNWLDTFKLTLNTSKTNYIAFSITSVQRPYFHSIHVNNFEDDILEVDSIKYLGVIIDSNLKWDRHILRLVKNIKKLIHKFYILREILSRKLLISVYGALVGSLLRYGIVAWGGIYQNSIYPLKVVQNYLVKIIYRKNKRYSTNLLYSKDILDVRTLYCLTTCSYIHKTNRLKQFLNHAHDTRGTVGQQLQIPINNTSKKLRSFSYLAPKMYNLLPLEIRSLQRLNTFNSKCKIYICDNIPKFKDLFNR